MKIVIQLTVIVLIGIVTPLIIGLLFLAAPIVWLFRKVESYIGSDMVKVVDNEPATLNHRPVSDRVLWSN